MSIVKKYMIIFKFNSSASSSANTNIFLGSVSWVEYLLEVIKWYLF